MRLISKLAKILFIFILTTSIGSTEESNSSKNAGPNVTSDSRFVQKAYLFKGAVDSDNINIRSDSTVSSEVICKINKDENVEVLLELYDWYKIRLPRYAPSYIKKSFVTFVDEKNGKVPKVSKQNVNIRIRPDLSSPILGRVNKNGIIKILEDVGEWYKIEPVSNSFGWIHKNFVSKVEEKEIVVDKKLEKKNEVSTDNNISIEGIIRAKKSKQMSAHKLISKDNKVYLLKGKREEFSALNRHLVEVTGKLLEPSNQNPIIEVEKIEVLD